MSPGVFENLYLLKLKKRLGISLGIAIKENLDIVNCLYNENYE